MFKIKQLFGMGLFLFLYALISILNQSIFPFFNPKSLLFYICPILLMIFLILTFDHIRLESSLIIKIISYPTLIFFGIIEFFYFFLHYNLDFHFGFDIDWIAFVNNSTKFWYTGVPDMVFLEQMVIRAYIADIYYIIISLLILILLILLPVKSYLTIKKDYQTTSKISKELLDTKSISKRFFLVKPLNWIYIKQRFSFFRSVDKKKIISQDKPFFQAKLKQMLISFSIGMASLLFWLVVNLAIPPEGFMSYLTFNTSGTFSYYSIWYVLPFRLLMGIGFGYGFILLYKMWQQFRTILTKEFEKDLLKTHANIEEDRDNSQLGTS